MLKSINGRGIARISKLLVVGAALAALSASAQDRNQKSDPAIASSVSFEGEASAPDEPLSLWYRRPAKQWVEALAIGNGRLGAMIFGGVDHERIQLNEDTLYAGGPYDPSNPEALEALPEVRRLIFAGKLLDAHKLISQKMMAKPLREMPYETVGDLLLTFPGIESAKDYRRDLNLDTAVARVQFTSNGVKFTREMFASPVDQVIVLRLTADKPGQISFTASMRTPQKATVEAVSPHILLMSGTNAGAQGIEGKLKFQARVEVQAQGGNAKSGTDAIIVEGADSATLLIAAATSYKDFKDVSGDPGALTESCLKQAAKKPFAELSANHTAEYQRLFRRVSLDLGTTDTAKRPTDERIRDFAKGNDPQLVALYFQFGRYLLLSCSRPGGQPANLQGLWNESMTPPWESKYTININTEMNYWPAETCNLAECVEPLVGMIMDLSESGARTAQVNYGARGWVAHHNTDLWRATGPIDAPQSGMWPTGGAWLCQHLWEHYLFGGDKKFLAKVYPAMKGASLFFLDTLVEDPNTHYLVTCPSNSPEHGHGHGNLGEAPSSQGKGRGPTTTICAGPTMDEQIIRDLFTHTIEAAGILKVDRELCDQLAAARKRLAPNKIGSEGQLQEWQDDWDMTADDIHHRHVSHLYGLFPSEQISPRSTPELAAAVRKSLEIRGDNATGWGLGWRLNLWGRLLDGDHAYEILQKLLTSQRTYPNMFDAHPPFQIDGNFGGTAGIAEMLLQSQGGEIELLPALPKAWPNGSVKGLRARGGFEVAIDWHDGSVTQARIHSLLGQPCKVRSGDKTRDLTIEVGKDVVLHGDLKQQ